MNGSLARLSSPPLLCLARCCYSCTLGPPPQLALKAHRLRAPILPTATEKGYALQISSGVPADEGAGGQAGALGRLSGTCLENSAATFSLTFKAAVPEVSAASVHHLHIKTRQLFISSDGNLPSYASVLGRRHGG